MLIIKRPPINTDNNDDHFETLVGIQTKADKSCNTFMIYNSIPIESTVAFPRKDRGPWVHGTIV